MVNIDSILTKDGINVQTRLTKYSVNWTECWGTKWHNENDIETEEVEQTDDSLTYDQLITAVAPTHYYRLAEALVATAPDDIGTLNQDGTYGAGTTVNQTGLLTNDLNKAAKFGSSDNTKYVNVANFKFPVDTGSTTYVGRPKAFSIEFMIKLDASPTAGEAQIIMGQWTSDNQHCGKLALCRTTAGKNYLVYNYLYGTASYALGSFMQTNVPWVWSELQANTTYHIVITYKNSTLSIYKNGVLMMSSSAPATSGLYGTSYGPPYVDNTKAFRIGYSGAFAECTGTVTCAFTLDEVAIYDKGLSAFDVYRHYFKSKNGYTDSGGGTGDPPAVDACDNRTLPTLGTGTDVTQYVIEDTLTINRGEDTLVDSMEFSCSESWGYSTLATVFQANDYIIVERRYSDLNGALDTGWVSIGHFLIEGPYGKEVTAEGRKVYKVTCKGITKLLGVDAPILARIEPDKVFISRRDMTDVTTGIDYKSFRIARPGVTAQYYENISVFPTPKLWASAFTTVGDIVTVSDTIRAKGAEESVQFLYGSGTFRIDTDYFNAKVVDKGLGAPGTMEVEAYRHLTVDDIYRNMEITDIIKTTSGPDIIYAGIRVLKADVAINSAEEYVGRTLFIQDGTAKGYMYRITSFTDATTKWEFGVTSYAYEGLPDIADDGVAAGDLISIGDANTAAQALTKVFLFAGYQNTDSTKPFYFEFVEPDFDGGVTLPPLKYRDDDSKTWLNIVKDILDACPPNFVLYTDTAGITRTANIIQKMIDSEDHDLIKVADYNIDGSDYGVITRVVARGSLLDPTDVGLNVNSGGTAAYGAYKLTNFSDWASNTGVTKTQAQADAIIDEIANGDPKTPAGWASDDTQQGYGAIWRVFGTSCRRWDMEDQDLFWIDLGTNDGKEYLIDEFELQVFPVFFPVGTIINQTLQIYYMTEDDYISATGDVPPTTSNDATVNTNLESMATSPFWRPLTSEFPVSQDGLTIVPASEFDGEEPLRMRFIKFKVGQPFHHPIYNDSLYAYPYSIIAIAGLKIYTSRDIIQVARLGFTPPFDTDANRTLAKRLRQRTLFLEENPYIQTTTQGKDFALQELQERYFDFEPIAIACVSPSVELWDTVKWTNPESGAISTYIVKSISYTGNGFTNMQIIDFRYFSES